MEGYELSASVVLWRGHGILLMKRNGGFGGGGWFLPGGHIEMAERPAEAAARELMEEAAIALDPSALSLASVMSYTHDGRMAHTLIYNALCPEGAEAVINEEHLAARWYEPEAAIARFFDSTMLRLRGVSEANIALAAEVARAIREAVEARGMRLPGEARPPDAPVTPW